jgi:hypothetical protein
MNTALCRKFPALDPFAVRRERYRDVLRIFARLRDQAERDGTPTPEKPSKDKLPQWWIKQVDSKGNVTIMRPATNDERW